MSYNFLPYLAPESSSEEITKNKKLLNETNRLQNVTKGRKLSTPLPF